MIRNWTDDGWRRRFAWFPIFLSDGPKRQIIWMEWVWKRNMGIFTEISLENPRNSKARMEKPND